MPLTMKAQALWMRLREEKWDDYAVSAGQAQRLDKVLQDLASRKKARAMKACHEVWKLLCSGGVRSAAVVTVPYLVEILSISTEDVQMEIADVLRDCAAGARAVEENWSEALCSVLIEQLSSLQRYHNKAKGDAAIAFDSCVDAIVALTK